MANQGSADDSIPLVKCSKHGTCRQSCQSACNTGQLTGPKATSKVPVELADELAATLKHVLNRFRAWDYVSENVRDVLMQFPPSLVMPSHTEGELFEDWWVTFVSDPESTDNEPSKSSLRKIWSSIRALK